VYLKFYGLETNPFSIAPDPRFFYGSEAHREGLAHLQYGMSQQKGFVLITGEVGTGKTTLLNLLLSELPTDTRIAMIANPKLSTNEFFHLTARAFGLGEIRDKADFLVRMGQFLETAKKNRQDVVLVVDEAHTLSSELLEEIRLLSNLETPQGKLMNIILVGQPEIKETLAKPDMRALNQRITLRYKLRPLTRQETREYILVRLGRAGAKDAEIFSMPAIDRIFDYTGGIPRMINILADKAMLTGFVKDIRTIDEKTIDECAQEMEMKPPAEEDHHLQSRIAIGTRRSRGSGKPLGFRLALMLCIILIILAAMAAYWGREVINPILSILSERFF